MFTKQFVLDTLERAVKTFAQTVAALLSAIVLAGGTLGSVNWTATLSIGALAAVYSVVTSIASSGVKSPNSASLVS